MGAIECKSCDIQNSTPVNIHTAVAQEYENAPILDPQAVYAWTSLARDVGRLYRYVLSKGVCMCPRPKSAYQTFDQICNDVEQGRIVRGLDFYPHPVWDCHTQALFRTVHDYFHYETGLDFTVEGEKEICEKHHRYAFDPASYPAIVAEIYGQAAYGVVYGKDPMNKVYIPRMCGTEHNDYVEYRNRTLDFSKSECNLVLDVEQWG